jgi:hypothetical protein
MTNIALVALPLTLRRKVSRLTQRFSPLTA